MKILNIVESGPFTQVLLYVTICVHILYLNVVDWSVNENTIDFLLF